MIHENNSYLTYIYYKLLMAYDNSLRQPLPDFNFYTFSCLFPINNKVDLATVKSVKPYQILSSFTIQTT